MRMVYNLSAAHVCLALLATGCALDNPGPEPDIPIDISLDFCSDEMPIWFARQSGSGPFEVQTPDASGTYSFQATSRTAIAFVRQNGADYKTHIIYTSNLDLQPLSGLACLEESGTKQVNGSVTGLGAADLGLVSLGFGSVYLTSAQSNFTLTQLVDRPLDVIASRVGVDGNAQNSIKTVIRRSQNPVNGATLTPIDFLNEGFAPAISAATVNGVNTEEAFLNNTFFSQLETSHTLTFVDQIADGVVSFVSVPTAELATGDYNDLFAIAVGSVGSRGVEQFFRNPANKSLAIGPPLAEPTVTVIQTIPAVRVRTVVAGQFDYSTTINILLHQQSNFASRDVDMTVTASYLGGTPTQWNLPTPSFEGVPGWQNTWGLEAGSTIDWTVTGYFGRPQLLLGAKPVDGETVQFASHSSTVATAQLSRTAREVTRPPRPGHFSRLR